MDIAEVRSHLHRTSVFTYTEKEVILYALGLGCVAQRYVFEGDKQFAALPSYVVVPAFGVLDTIPFKDYVPNFTNTNLLHGEHYVELLSKIPTSGRMHTTTRVLDIQNKGNAALVIIGATTVDAVSNMQVAYQEFTCFIRNAGCFEVVRKGPSLRCQAAAASHPPPQRPPDVSVSEATSKMQACLYRLSGDMNPLHADPEFAAAGGFPRPILHGLCTMGFAVKHILGAYAGGDPSAVKSIKVRFVKHVFPGETLRTEMWLQGGHRVVFRTLVVERGEVAIANAAVVLHPGKVQLPARL